MLNTTRDNVHVSVFLDGKCMRIASSVPQNMTLSEKVTSSHCPSGCGDTRLSHVFKKHSESHLFELIVTMTNDIAQFLFHIIAFMSFSKRYLASLYF